MTDPFAPDEQLRSALAAITPAPPDAANMRSAVEQRVADRRRRRLRTRGLLAALVVVATGVTVAAIARSPSSTPVRIGPASSPTAPITKPAPTAMPATGPPGAPAGGIIAVGRLAAFQMLGPEQGIGLTSNEGGTQRTTANPIQLAVTTDGGRTWRAEGRPLPWLEKFPASRTPALPGQGLLAFTSTRVGYVVTDHLYFTDDGGTTWAPVPATHVPAQAITAGGGRIWAVGWGCGSPPRSSCSTLATAQPGATDWTIHQVPIPDAQLVIAPSGSTLILTQSQLGVDGSVDSATRLSTDGGATWTPVINPCAGRLVAASNQVWFFACDLGGPTHPQHPVVYRSTDAGGQWQRWASFTQGYGGNSDGPQWTTLGASPDATRLWLTPPEFQTQLGELSAGASTVQTAIPLNTYVAGLDMLDVDRAWVLAPEQGLWSTIDGGATWQEIAIVAGP